ncbi:MAG TPA: CPBP family intramembrane glutamic endopeptidase [Dyella sp.]|uniref:CPBP family intramembrane glutamic endopeptidase n=1 Tax=Dyella sp. TaxID=1869338 RepID=UPI002F92DD19
MSALPPALPSQRGHLRLALLLALAAAVATLLLQPYLMVLLAHTHARIRLPLWQLVGIQVLQTTVLCLVLGWLGLIMGARYRLDAPWLRAWVEQRPNPSLHGRWLLAIVLGAISAVIVVALDYAHAESAMTHHIGGRGLDLAWRGALASFYGGTAEEIMCRLFLVNLFVWLAARLHRGQANRTIYIAAIVLAALLFGAGHLPALVASGGHFTVFTVTRVIGLNALVGFFFGTIYWKFGLEHAMVAHFSADIVLHVIAPLLLN